MVNDTHTRRRRPVLFQYVNYNVIIVADMDTVNATSIANSLSSKRNDTNSIKLCSSCCPTVLKHTARENTKCCTPCPAKSELTVFFSAAVKAAHIFPQNLAHSCSKECYKLGGMKSGVLRHTVPSQALCARVKHVLSQRHFI